MISSLNWIHSIGWPTIAISLITLYTVHFRWKTNYWSRFGLKSPFAIPVLGTQWIYFRKAMFLAEEELVQVYGRIVGLYEGTKPAILIADRHSAKEILVKEFHRFPQSTKLPYLHPEEEKYLTTLWGPEWKALRSKLSPTFTTGKLKRMFTILRSCTDECHKYIERKLQSTDTFDLKRFWGRYNMDVIAKCFFATNVDAYNVDKESAILKDFENIFHGNIFGIFLVLFGPEWYVKLTKQSFTRRENLVNLRDLVLEVIETRKKERKTIRNDFLQLLLEGEDDNGDNNNPSDKTKAKSTITMDEIISSCLIFLIAGYETTSTLLTWTCWYLAMNPEIQEKLYQEVSQLDALTYENVNTLPYLEAVLNETLRTRPPAGQLRRLCHEDYQLPGTKVIIPKGSNVLIPVYAMHQDPEYFPDPQVFNPERFMPENKDCIPDHAFIPFGGGPRLCIGQRFALISAKLSLASILMKYRFFVNEQTITNPTFKFHSLGFGGAKLLVGVKTR